MKTSLNILHLEDDSNDALLVKLALAAGDIPCTITVVHSRIDFVAALEDGDVDLILSDFSLPTFDGLSAAEIVKARWPTIPLIVVSGTLGEDLAIDSLKSGATDYVLKERLSRLAPAIRRAMQEVQAREERRRAEEVSSREQKFSEGILDSLPGVFYLFDQSLKFLRWNKRFETVLGYSFEEFARLSPLDLFRANEREYITGNIQEVFTAGTSSIEACLISKDGTGTPYYFTSRRI